MGGLCLLGRVVRYLERQVHATNLGPEHLT